MIISDEHKFIYLAIPRTGSTTIQVFLQEFGWRTPNVHDQNHGSVNFARGFVGEEKWQNYKKITFIRNPWDWYVSLFRRVRNYRRQHGGPPLETIIDYLDISQDGDSQEDFLVEDDKIVMDFVGKFETLEDDIRTLAKFIGIPIPEELRQVNKNKERPHYTTFYTEDWMIEKVATNEKFVIDTYGYKFGEDGDK